MRLRSSGSRDADCSDGSNGGKVQSLLMGAIDRDCDTVGELWAVDARGNWRGVMGHFCDGGRLYTALVGDPAKFMAMGALTSGWWQTKRGVGGGHGERLAKTRESGEGL